MIIKETPKDFIVEEVPNFVLKDFSDYAIYKLTKINMNTEQAIENVCRKFNIQRKRIKYAGTKDKIAITTQYISIYKDTGKLMIDEENMALSFVGFSDEPLSLGSLKGNKFEIILRELEAENLERLKFQIKNSGIIIPNYFDEQRFSQNNHKIGLAILKKDYKTATEIILKSTGHYENDVKEHLMGSQNDYVGAIRKIPSKIISMYLHSVQSLFFNNALQDMLREQAAVRRLAYSEASYSAGKFVFYSDIEDYKKILFEELPLIGFDTNMMSEHIAKQLKALGVTQRDFIIRAIPDLTVEGGSRKCFAQVQDFSCVIIDERTVKLKFFLEKGSYATIAVKALFN